MWSYRYSDQSNDYLQHFGIFGMRWGVRRFQNPDGSLTEEGKKRYYNSTNDDLSDEGRKAFFKNNSSKNLTKEGEKALKSGDKKTSDLIRSEQFGRDYYERWLPSYNEAADVFNSKIDSINKKYGDNPAKDKKTYRKYLQEVGSLWKNTYGEILLRDFGEHPTIGKKWIQNAIMYGTYDNLDDFIDEMTE
jgi:hypothetical protein